MDYVFNMLKFESAVSFIVLIMNSHQNSIYICLEWMYSYFCKKNCTLVQNNTCTYQGFNNVETCTIVRSLYLSIIKILTVMVMIVWYFLCNQCLSPLKLWVPTRTWRCELDTTLCDKVWQWLATGRWFSPGTPVSSTNKTDHHDITEILLKVALNTINQPNQPT